jgi:hypothetical protein
VTTHHHIRSLALPVSALWDRLIPIIGYLSNEVSTVTHIPDITEQYIITRCTFMHARRVMKGF